MTLTDVERRALERRSHSRKGRADDARRAQCILLLADGVSWAQSGSVEIAVGQTGRAGNFAAVIPTLRAGVVALPPSAWPGSTAGIAGNRPACSRRSWKPGFSSGRAAGRRMARRIGVAAAWRRGWGSRI